MSGEQCIQGPWFWQDETISIFVGASGGHALPGAGQSTGAGRDPDSYREAARNPVCIPCFRGVRPRSRISVAQSRTAISAPISSAPGEPFGPRASRRLLLCDRQCASHVTVAQGPGVEQPINFTKRAARFSGRLFFIIGCFALKGQDRLWPCGRRRKTSSRHRERLVTNFKTRTPIHEDIN